MSGILQGFMMGYFGRADFSLKLCVFASEETEFWRRGRRGSVSGVQMSRNLICCSMALSLEWCLTCITEVSAGGPGMLESE